MDLIGSIADTTVPISLEAYGSLATDSAAIDTVIGGALYTIPNTILGLIADFFADLGSTRGEVMY